MKKKLEIALFILFVAGCLSFLLYTAKNAGKAKKGIEQHLMRK